MITADRLARVRMAREYESPQVFLDEENGMFHGFGSYHEPDDVNWWTIRGEPADTPEAAWANWLARKDQFEANGRCWLEEEPHDP